MNFKLRKLNYTETAFPTTIPELVTPIQDNNEIIKGDMSALKILFKDKEFWVTSQAPLKISNGKETIRFMLSKKELRLPYEITLETFKMNKYPGTNNPASFESFVNLLDGRTTNGLQKSHIFMNNPLKYDSFTFYQSSYFPLDQEQTQFGSVLSVNYDPGRFFKYLASLFIVFGSIWHFYLNRKRIRK